MAKRKNERERTQEKLSRLIVKTGQSLDKLADAFAELQNTAANLVFLSLPATPLDSQPAIEQSED